MYSTSFIFLTMSRLTLKRLNTFWSRISVIVERVTILKVSEEYLDRSVRVVWLHCADYVYADSEECVDHGSACVLREHVPAFCQFVEQILDN
jgi:hypothetical protein